MNRAIIIIGAFHETIELCESCGYTILGLVDNSHKGSYMGYSILGVDNDVDRLHKQFANALIVVGPDNPKVKRKLFELYKKAGFKFATIISPKANISKTATIGEGCIVQTGVNVSANTIIGRFCKLNFNCNVMHDVSMGEFATIAPNAVILGRSILGKGVYIGANSTVEHDTIVADEIKIPAATFYSNNNNGNFQN
jgi:sugar O-acyltransferase (sialic acid O-acetyltransferase NeuD family)